ncbi:MAG: hypothetical protein K2N63_12990 [Lachnospiraceae bacterium]|nr:hypothetical protein [Lachnospiraceae bacterium]
MEAEILGELPLTTVNSFYNPDLKKEIRMSYYIKNWEEEENLGSEKQQKISEGKGLTEATTQL